MRGNRDLIICRCEEVSEEEIVRVIDEGAESLNDIKRRTRAGMGFVSGTDLSAFGVADSGQGER